MQRVLNLSLFLYLLLVLACTDDGTEIVPTSGYEKGVFVSNEGNFGEGDGSLSFLDVKGNVFNHVFASANPNSGLGDVVQSLHLVGDQLFIVVNNSNKVEVVSLAEGLKTVYTLNDVLFPRNMTSMDGKGYLTEWVSFTEPGRVTVFDLASGAIEKEIVTDVGAEDLYIIADKLFVTNTFTTTLSVIDLASQSLDTSIIIGNAPASMAKDMEGKLWVLCKGGYDGADPMNDGKWVQVDPETLEILQEVPLNVNVAGKSASNPSNDAFYYINGNSVFVMDPKVASTRLFLEEGDAVSLYGIGVHPDGRIFAADAKGFLENGEVFVYLSSGERVQKFTAGRGPNGFAFIP